jgi:hypothetical protein
LFCRLIGLQNRLSEIGARIAISTDEIKTTMNSTNTSSYRTVTPTQSDLIRKNLLKERVPD